MTEQPDNSLEQEARFHTYVTGHIPWYVHAMWVGFWIGAVWYTVKFTIPMVRNYF